MGTPQKTYQMMLLSPEQGENNGKAFITVDSNLPIPGRAQCVVCLLANPLNLEKQMIFSSPPTHPVSPVALLSLSTKSSTTYFTSVSLLAPSTIDTVKTSPTCHVMFYVMLTKRKVALSIHSCSCLKNVRNKRPIYARPTPNKQNNEKQPVCGTPHR